MSGNPRASRVFLWINSLAVGVPGLGCAAPPGSANDMARCAVITAADERLEEERRRRGGPPVERLAAERRGDGLQPVRGGRVEIAASDERLACYDARAKPKSPEPQGAPAVAARPASKPDDAASFGVIRRTLVSEPGPQQIGAVVTGLSVDRQGSVLVSLDNGQSWTVKDADARLNAGDAVTIRRAALGSFLMTTPSRHTYRVQRTK